MLKRMVASSLVTVGSLLALAAPSMAASPQVETWSNHVDREYFECSTFTAHGVWDISHKLTIFVDSSGTPIRDIEVVEFTGAFVNPGTGVSIPDSGRATYFDTLDANGDYLTTMSNVVRHSAYFHSAGRNDFQTGAFHGTDRFDAGVPAACAALGD